MIVVSAPNVQRVNLNKVARHSRSTGLNRLANPRVCR
jgi:hypothetical protein